MKCQSNSITGHALALTVIVIWGTTFVATKALISCGLAPQDIFLLRFIIAYSLIWFISPKQLFCDSCKDELLMIALGITGGSLYFLAENYAIALSYCSNVSLIVCSAPLMTSIIMSIFYKKERMNKRQWTGSLIALIGMGTVVLNGNFVLHLSPLGDLLALTASITWGLYSLTIHSLHGKYSTTMINRKLFFYGIITILPVCVFTNGGINMDILLNPTVIINLIFLGIIASMVCYVAWNKALYAIGTVRATNYLYFSPIATYFSARRMVCSG